MNRRACAAITFGFALVFGGCGAPAPKTDLLEVGALSSLEGLIDMEAGAVKVGTDTATAAGALLVTPTKSDHLSVAGSVLDPKHSSADYDRTIVDILLYSPVAMKEIEQRIADETGGASFNIRPAKTDETLQAALSEYNVTSPPIGVIVNFRNGERLEQYREAILEKLGEGIPMDHLDVGQYWDTGAYIIALADEYNTLTIMDKSQVVKGCLLMGFSGVLDLGGCDREDFAANLMDYLRVDPANK